MAILDNIGGGGGGNIRYDQQTDYIQVKANGNWVNYKRAYATFDGTIYADGVQAVPLDNSGYPASTSTPQPYNGATLTSNSFYFDMSTSAAGGDFVIFTEDKISLAGFTTLRCTCNGNNYALDISSYQSEEAYVGVHGYNSNNSTMYLYMGIYKTKNYFENSANKYTVTTSGTLPTGTKAGMSAYEFTKLWLE